MATAASWFLAIVLAGASVSKLAAHGRFLRTLAAIPWLPLRAARLGARAIPLGEIVLAGALAAGAGRAALLVAVSVLVLFTLVSIIERASGRSFDCGCFGGVDVDGDDRGLVPRNMLLVAVGLTALATTETDSLGAILTGVGLGMAFLLFESARDVRVASSSP